MILEQLQRHAVIDASLVHERTRRRIVVSFTIVESTENKIMQTGIKDFENHKAVPHE